MKARYFSQWMSGLLVLGVALAESPHRIDVFRIDGDRAVFQLSRREAASTAETRIEFFHATSLTSTWRKVEVATLPEKKTELRFELPLPQSSNGTGFWCVEGFVDSDGDGLSDFEERCQHGTDPLSSDTDGDGLPDVWEVRYGLDPTSAENHNGADGDPDGDAMPNMLELSFGTDPTKADTDGDGMSDRWEAAWGLDPLNSEGDNGPDGDPDMDGVPNSAEYVLQSNPRKADTDDDGLDDWFEWTWGFDPCYAGDAEWDCDGDWLTNREECEWGTDPWNPDTDGDGKSDGWEVANGEDPLSAYDAWWLVEDDDGDGLTNGEELELGTDPSCTDTDDDGLPDGWEVRYGLDPTSAEQNDGPFGDPDGDAMPNMIELQFGTDPTKWDTDGDGMSDRWEAVWGLDPLSPEGDDGADGDPDGDGLRNAEEYLAECNPKKADTDGDGIDDKTEIEWGMNPNWDADANQDYDDDGLTMVREYELKTDAFNGDTDGDGLDDGKEITFGSDPCKAKSINAYYDDKVLYDCGQKSVSAIIDEYGYTLWERLFYPTNGIGMPIIPESSMTHTVVSISGSGEGAGSVSICGKEVPVCGGTTPLKVAVPRNERVALEVTGEADVRIDSDEFCIGSLGGGPGWLEILGVTPNRVCIHKAGDAEQTLSISCSDNEVTCTWSCSGSLSVTQTGPRSAVVSGKISKGDSPSVTGRLSHPNYLGGSQTFDHPFEVCKNCLEEEEDEEEEAEPGEIGEDVGPTSEEETEEKSQDCGCETIGCDIDTCTCFCHPWNQKTKEEIFEEFCPTHQVPYKQCEHLHSQSYSNVVNRVEQSRVLKIRNPEVCDSVMMNPPESGDVCCHCPEHAHIDYATIGMCSGKLRVEYEGCVVGSGFQSDEMRMLEVFGVSPSHSVGDAQLSIVRGGDGTESYLYTVLGLQILGGSDEDESSATEVTISTGTASPVVLKTDVALSGGDVHLALKNASVPLEIWYINDQMEWVKLLDSEEQTTFDTGLARWRKMAGGSDGEPVSLYVYVIAESAGTAELEFGYAMSKDGRNVTDTVRKKLRCRGPRLVFDYDRNGQIDSSDVKKAKSGETTFRFWINGDNDSGSVCADKDYTSDITGSSRNCDDESVNGLRDLVDFTPVWIDLADSFPAGTEKSEKEKITWKLRCPNANVVWTSLTRTEAGEFQKSEKKCFGEQFDESVLSARVYHDSGDGIELDEKFVKAMLEDSEKGVFLIEGCKAGTELVLEGRTDTESENPLFIHEAKISISSVEAMYRWLGLRSSLGQGDINPCVESGDEPPNRPDDECDGRNYVFVHGFNTNSEEARAIGAEMFKRLWQSGLKSMYTVVNWYGNEDQFSLNGSTKSLNYYGNAYNAFLTAPDLAAACNELPGSKVMIAHSLGNMLVSSAAVDHGLGYEKYYLLNAAVAAEAYDSSITDNEMVPYAWKNVKKEYRSPDWHRLFPADDFRSTLSWHGRFAGIRNVVNCYSTTEDVVGDATNAITAVGRSVWVGQELLKGSWEMDAIGYWPGLEITSEGGWGINMSYRFDTTYYSLTQYKPTVNALEPSQVIKIPLFTSFGKEGERMSSTERFAPPSDAWQLRAKFLCDAIPATSHAAGMRTIGGGVENKCFADLINEKMTYPRLSGGVPQWYHSDLKNVAYIFNYKLYDYLLRR